MRKYLSLPGSKWNCLVFLAVLGSTSCSGGDKLNPVRGKVLHKDKPIGGVLVTFHPKERGNDPRTVLPVGFTKEDGGFALSSGQHEGAPAGEYSVTFIHTAEGQKEKKVISAELPVIQDRFQGAYANPGNSAFRVEIRKGFNELEPFRLK